VAALLPALVLGLVFLVALTKSLRLRLGFLASAIVCACYLAAVTESLSPFGALRPIPVFVAWIAAAAASLLWILLHRDRVWLALRGAWAMARNSAARLDPVEWLCVCGIAVILCITAVTALASPPNTVDVMDYHMPRVSEWVLRRSIDFFPTHYLVQLFYPPLAEWTILHLNLLAGDDRFANIVQWFGFFGSIVAISLIARLIGGDRRAQLVSALLCATLPQGVLAASGAKNDWTATFCLCASCVFLLRWALAERPAISDAVFAGLALGLAVLTKGTTYLFAPAILLGCLASIRRRPRLQKAWHLLLLPLLVLALNSGQYVRNYRLTQSPIGYSSPNGDGYEPWRSSSFTPQRVAANVIRNAALHFGTRSEHLNAAIGGPLAAVIRALGVDPNDPATTWTNSPFRLNKYSFNEYYAGNPLHLLLFLAAAGWIFCFWKNSSPALRCFMLGVIAAYLFYCAYVPWNRWGARLQLTPFALSCAVVGCVLVRGLKRLLVPALSLSTLMALPSALLNTNRPLIGTGGHANILRASRDQLDFIDAPQRKEPYLAAIAEIQKTGCRVIGVDTSQDIEQFEYPFFAAFNSPDGHYSVRDVGVRNSSIRFASAVDRLPTCSVICLACENNPGKMRQYMTQLPRVKQLPRLVLFLDESPVHLAH
jgi:4-amino-4-deoxy-L-arabinose transferase-like glycosyltransferase